MRTVHVLNLGAGVQSTVVFMKMALGGLPCADVAIFADTQEEPAGVYRHLDWLRANFKRPRILTVTAGKLGDDLMRGRNSTGQRFASIPAFTRAGENGPIGRTKRQCSKEYKTEPIERAIRRQVLGLKPGREIPAGVELHQYFGISRDEGGRAVRIKARVEARRRWYAHFPLIEMGWTRADCLRWLKTRVPHAVVRSACVFCPYRSDAEFRALEPSDWARAVQIDEALRTSGTVANRDMRRVMYIHRSATPLATADLGQNQGTIDFSLECEGLCGV